MRSGRARLRSMALATVLATGCTAPNVAPATHATVRSTREPSSASPAADARGDSRHPERALRSTAFTEHRAAQRDRRRCLLHAGAPEDAPCRSALTHYAAAVEAYRAILQTDIESPEALELRYNLADALYWSGRYEEAAAAYAVVRDWEGDDRYVAAAGRRVVESLSRLVEAAVRDGVLVIRDSPPDPRADPLPIPPLLRRGLEARELYLARVSPEADEERMREPYAYNIAVVYRDYGYRREARERFARIFADTCTGPGADETGELAFLSLTDMAHEENDAGEVERLSRERVDRGCTFGAWTCPPGEAWEPFCADRRNADLACCTVMR